MAEINVTPFVDVMLVLLIIFMVAAPLLTVGVPLELPRTAAAGLTAALTVAGVVYVTFFSDTFIGPFQGFLTTLGVPMAVWAGMFVTDVIVRKKDYSTPDL